MQKANRTGETTVACNGLSMTIIKYNNCDNIDVQFSDGTIVRHKTYQNFKAGNIKNPNINNDYISGKLNKCNKRIGETNIACNGLKMTIIKYRDAKNIDIQFEDGLIIKHKTYNSFKRGEIKHPDMTVHNRIQQKYKHKYINTENIMSNGMIAKCIRYKTYQDADIQFEDGIIINHVPIYRFLKGNIMHPTKNSYTKRTENCKHTHMGELSVSSDNLNAQIIKYNNANDITIRFENGITKHNVKYYNFRNGRFAMPNKINNTIIKSFAYKLNDDWYYICYHPDWTEDKILSIKEIYNIRCPKISEKKVMHKRFTKNELKLIMDFSIPNEQLAKQLNRSLSSIVTKRSRIKHNINNLTSTTI